LEGGHGPPLEVRRRDGSGAAAGRKRFEAARFEQPERHSRER
jgi:hypothetical protein